MAITRAQQFRQMLEDGGMLVKPGNGKRPGYRGDDAAFSTGAKQSGRADPRTSSSYDGSRTRDDSGGRDDSVTVTQAQRDQFKADRKQATRALKKAGKKDKGIGDFFDNFAAVKFARALKNSEFNKRRRANFMKDLDALSKRFQTRRNINLPFGISFDANARINNNILQNLLNKAKEELGVTTGTFQGPGPFNFEDLPISLSDLPEDKQNEIYDKVMKARMSGQTDAAGNLAPGFMFDAQGNIISTGNDGRDTEAERLALLAQATNPNQSTTPTEETPAIDPTFYRLAADGGMIEDAPRAGFRQAGIAGREYDKADTATREAISREQDRGATPTSEQFRDQARDIRRREIPEGVKRAASAISLFTPIGQIEEARKLKKFLQLKKAIDLGKNIKDVYDDDEDETIGVPSLDIENIRQNPYEDLPGPNLRAEVGKQDIRASKMRGFENMKYGDYKDIMNAGPGTNITPFEFEELKKGNITKPGTYTAAEGGRIGAMEGGIMDAESGRQMYFLGKLVKKATRAVKKIVKSPIGLAGLGFLAMQNPAISGFIKKKAMPFLFKEGTIGSGLTGGGMLALGGALTAAPFLFGKEEEEEQTIDPSMLGPTINIAEILANPYRASLGMNFRRTAADGGRMGYSEGSKDVPTFREFVRNSFLDSGQRPKDLEDLDIKRITLFSQAYQDKYGEKKADGGIMRIGYQEGSKEPVAKKTMPLLDMDGQEMDLRDNGGFVPIGRMEKADDVPARLSKNEFVFTADAVRNAGDGDIDKGAEVMYNMMKNLEDGGNVSEESQGLEGARNMFQTAQRLEEVL